MIILCLWITLVLLWNEFAFSSYFASGPYHWQSIYWRQSATYCDERVWLFVCQYVCLSASISKRPLIQTPHVSMRVNCGRCSILLWCQCDALCTSGFVDDVMFHIMGVVACSVGSIYVITMLLHVVINFHCRCVNVAYLYFCFCLPFLFVFFLLPFLCVLPSLLFFLSLTFQNIGPAPCPGRRS